MSEDVNRADIEQRVTRLAWPQPPSGLRTRVLSAARLVPQRVAWPDRVYFSRAWRLAAAAIVVFAVGVVTLPAPADRQGDPSSQAEVRAIGDITREIGIPDDVAERLASRALLASRLNAPDAEARAAPQFFETEGDRR